MNELVSNPACEQCEALHRSVFSTAGIEDLHRLYEAKRCYRYKKGQMIIQEGKYADGIHCINSGNVKVFRSSEEGKEQILRFAVAGDVLGYKAVIGNQPYANSAEALEEAHICFIPRDAFFHIVRTNPSFALNMMEYITKELRLTEEHLVHLAQKPLRARLAELLLILRETFGVQDDGTTINISLTREDIASILGTATESAIRMLSDFHNEGLIDLPGKRIRIVDAKALLTESHAEHHH